MGGAARQLPSSSHCNREGSQVPQAQAHTDWQQLSGTGADKRFQGQLEPQLEGTACCISCVGPGLESGQECQV